MNLKNLSKEQKQKYALMGVVGVAVLFALKQFALSPLLASHASAKEELSALKNKLEQADRVLKRDETIAKEASASSERMRTASRDLLPSADNALAWATKALYAHARTLGIDIESVADQEGDQGGFLAKDQEKRVFKPYGVRVATQCSYADLERLLQALESSNPYVIVSGLTIAGQLTAPERHQIILNIEWPSWKKAEKSRAFLDEEKHETS